ncbi:HlyD family type I secretion periplasmic adaptor subunit [Yersinia aleksiciae]|uniref:Membrane fusion protein (MFP) family protein n=1 Tax=Yersinia aleksiciae TaxID=263819 RepID=A0A0T9UZS0_YERAE|nr:HlyD family type I secretion periplasmic adaptor subunit [Yersinia aleksiciae]MDA5499831.1 HlyD family type I secretion periplasmic adaptor subunit [Yersinia aleksiciae]NIL00916.1 HlyD family type I secretion periplasmic adaptor subunit [Yersinia aleksiciae]WQC70931.1 HlyD family type I secretion periplasmic adaptor subunit [Yersinia aleksiciae]CNL85196.1 HlyD family secretion protein [Yersinia aleksiciae]
MSPETTHDPATAVGNQQQSPQSVQTNSGQYLSLGGVLVLAGFIGFLLWAGLAPLDKGIAVMGQIVVAENRKVIQPLQGGRIQQLHVVEGDEVTEGQLLITLDDTAIRSHRDNLEHQYLSALAQESRLIAEQHDLTDIHFPEALLQDSAQHLVERIIVLQQQLFQHRRQAQLSEIARLSAQITRHQSRLSGLQRLKDNNQHQLDLFQQQLHGVQSLAINGHVAKNQLLEMERQAISLRTQVEQDASDIAETYKLIDETEQHISQRHEQYQSENREQLAKAQQSTQELAQRLSVAEFELKNTRITAPVSGSVIALAQHTIGGVVSTGQTLMELVPSGQPLLVEAQLPVALIDKAMVGLPVDLNFSAFNQSTTPRLYGSVLRVGADRIQHPQTLEPYYPLTIAMDINQTPLKIRPGMSVDIFIRTGERSLLNYLFKPLIDRLHVAFTEE